MGRFATAVAAALTDADNLPPDKSLPSISVIDALLPRSLINFGSRLLFNKDQNPLDPNIGRKTYVTYYNIKKSKNGSHRTDAKGEEEGKKNDKDGEKEKAEGDDKVKDDGKNDEKAKQGKEENGGKKNEDAAKFTAEEDEKLKALKAENTTWKQINEQIPGHGVNALKARFKEINTAKGAKDDTKDKPDEDKKDNKKNNQQNVQKESPTKGQNQTKSASQHSKNDKAQEQQSRKSSNHSKKNNEARFTMQEWITLQEDDMFSFGELQCLSELLVRDQSQTWDRVASAFFDKTGRRVHPHDIRDKFEAMI